jgi:hypothetical protein
LLRDKCGSSNSSSTSNHPKNPLLPLNHPLNSLIFFLNHLLISLFFSKSPPDPLFEEEGEIVGDKWGSSSLILNHPLNPLIFFLNHSLTLSLNINHPKPLFEKEGLSQFSPTISPSSSKRGSGGDLELKEGD